MTADPNTFTLDTLREAARTLRNAMEQDRPTWLPGGSGGYSAAPALDLLRYHLIACPYLVESRPRVLSRWERLRVWLEDATDRAELAYFWPRVQRSESVPSPRVYLLGDRLLCHPSLIDKLRQVYV